MPFEQVVAELGVERDVARSPLFQATFALHNFEMNNLGGSRNSSSATRAGLTGSWEALDLPVTRFDLELQAVASALTFQRLAFVAAVPQLVPKRFLGNANGLAQMSNGFANLLVPLVAAGLLATIGLGRILLLDVVSYVFALGVLAVVHFPNLMGLRRREPLLTEVANRLRYSWGSPALRALLLFRQ
jgi:Transmembrane secretion effector